MFSRLIYFFFLFFLLAKASTGYAQLKADFAASETKGCLPLPVSLTDLSTGNPDRWQWEFGDGRTSPLKNPALLYLLAGAYTVKLTVYKGPNDSSSISKVAYINVYEYPTVDFSANQLEGCRPFPVKFTNKSTPGSGTLANFNWDFGDGNSSVLQDPLHIYKATGRYTVVVSVGNSFGCKKTFSIPNYVRILDTIKADFSFTPQATCGAPFPVNFFDNSSGRNISSLNWSFGDGGTSNAINPVHTYASPGTYLVRLISTNAQGCSDTTTKSVSMVLGNFQSSFTAPEQACRGPKVRFTNTSTPLAQMDSAFWDFGDGSTSNEISPDKSFSAPGTYTVKLTSYFGICQLQSTRNITILTGPQTQFTASVTEACKPPLTVDFTNQTTNGTVFRWSLGNGIRTSLQNPTTTYSSNGLFTVFLVTQNTAGCYDTLTKTGFIKIQPPQVTDIPGLPFEGCFPWTKTFKPQITSSSPVVKWEWDFGDGTTSNLENPTKTFSQRGQYIVKLKMTTENGCVENYQSTVKGGLRPEPGFSAAPLRVCPSDLVNFSGVVKGVYDSLVWEFGDGGKLINLISPSYLYRDTGWMTVTLFAYDNGCADSLEIVKYIYVSPPFANFGMTSNCSTPYERQFLDSSFGATRWHWDFGNGDTSNVPSPLYKYSIPGNYLVKLTVFNGDCSHDKSVYVNILDEKPDFVQVESRACGDNLVTFEAKGPNLNLSNILTFTWRFSDNVNYVNVGSIIQRQFTQNTNLTLRLFVTDINGCNRSFSKNITVVIDGPKAKIKPPFTFACVGSKVVFPDSSQRSPLSTIVKWTWDFGDGTIKNFNAPPFEHIYLDTGYYNLSLRVEDQNGCSDSITVKKAVGVFSPRSDFESPDTIVCQNTEVHFVNLSKGVNLKYKWNLGEGDTSNLLQPVKKFALKGLFNISLEVTDTAGCKSVNVKPAYINVGGAKANFEVSDSFASCPPLRVNFTDKSIGSVQTKWDFGNGNTSLLSDPIQTYTSIGVFYARQVIIGTGGCTDTMVRKIQISGPQGNITYTPLSGCPPLQVMFSSSTNNVKTYIWDFSDGITEFTSDSTVVHTYLNPGTYRPRVILQDGQDCRIPIIGKQDVKVVGVRAFISSLPNYVYCDSASISFSDSSIVNDNIIRWKWDFGDGDTSVLPRPLHTYKKPGRYKVSLYVETADKCNGFTILPGEVVIAASPKVALNQDTSFCLPGKVVFRPRIVNTDTTNLTWLWNFGNGTTSTKPLPDSVLFDKFGIFYPKAVVTDNYGCSGSDSSKIIVHESAQSFALDLGSYPLCDSGTVAFKDSTINEGIITKWLWNFGDGATSDKRNPVHTFTKPGRYEVKLEVETDKKCVTIAIVPGNIIIGASPKMDIGPDTSFCIPSGVVFKPVWLNADTSRLSFKWNFGNGLTSTKENPDTVLYNKPGTYNVSLVTTNDYGCFDTVRRVVKVNDVPDIKFGIINPPILCDSGLVKFNHNVISNDPISTWAWTFGDGGTASVANPSHMFASPGRYKIGLSVSTAFNCIATASYPSEVIVAASPAVELWADSVFCGPDTVRFSGNLVHTDTTTLQWFWDFGNGKTSTSLNPLPVFYDRTGVYNASLKVTDNYGCSDLENKIITINDLPRVQISLPAKTVFCDLATVQFNDAVVTSDVITSWKWDFGDGTFSDQRKPTHSYTKPGRYPVKLEVITANNCFSPGQLGTPIIVAASPEISFPPDTSFCIPGNVMFNIQRLNPDTTNFNWAWNFGNGTLSASQGPVSVLYNRKGIYRASLVVTDNYGCIDSVYRMVEAIDSPLIVVSGTPVVCRGKSVQLFARGADRFTWENNSNLSCLNCDNPLSNALVDQTFRVTGFNGTGPNCSRTKDITIRIIQPHQSIASTGDTICIGNSFQLSVSGAYNYSWSPSNGLSANNIANPLARPLQTTVYRVISSDSLDCFRDTAFVPVVVFPKPTLKLKEDKITALVGTRLLLEGDYTDVTRWRWTPSVGLSCIACPNPELIVTQPITYRVMVTNPGGCQAVDQISIEPICSSEGVFVPNTFSPNGDGRNDLFYPMGKGVSTIKSLRIFNRWGEIVFEKTNLAANDPSAGWDGTYKGQPLSPDVYVYVMVLLCFNNETLEMKGNVTLLK